MYLRRASPMPRSFHLGPFEPIISFHSGGRCAGHNKAQNLTVLGSPYLYAYWSGYFEQMIVRPLCADYLRSPWRAMVAR